MPRNEHDLDVCRANGRAKIEEMRNANPPKVDWDKAIQSSKKMFREVYGR